MILAAIAWFLLGAVLFLLALYADLKRETYMLKKQFSLYKYSFEKEAFIKDCSVFGNIPGDGKDGSE